MFLESSGVVNPPKEELTKVGGENVRVAIKRSGTLYSLDVLEAQQTSGQPERSYFLFTEGVQRRHSSVFLAEHADFDR